MKLVKLIIAGILIITTFVVWSLFYDLGYLIDTCTLGFSAEQCIEWVEAIQRMADY
jgi:nitrate/nitrite transporter NarK